VTAALIFAFLCAVTGPALFGTYVLWCAATKRQLEDKHTTIAGVILIFQMGMAVGAVLGALIHERWPQ
jgi:predicted MFS family arabinose efflux permease